MKVRLYPPVKVIGKSFKNSVRHTVPMQSMSLREIVKRFVRRESLPQFKEGMYEDRFGDLEKLKKEDLVVQYERLEELRSQLKAMKKRIEDKEQEAKAAAEKFEEEKLQEAINKRAQQAQAQSLSPEKGNTAQKSTPIGA